MSRQNSIVVIGGTACGPKAACRARRLDAKSKITIIEQRPNLSSATCGLPYYVAGVIDRESTLVTRQPDYFRKVMNIEILIRTRASAIDRKARRVETVDLESGQNSSMEYDRLVLATGALPSVPDWPGKDLAGIFTLSSIQDAGAIRSYLPQSGTKKVTIIGAGLIGLEMAEGLVARGLDVTILEARDWALAALLDADMAAHVEKHLRSKGVKLLCGQSVTGFTGDDKKRVRRVITKGSEIEAGMVLLSVGIRPNVSLARDAGLTIGATGGIAVNEYLQTSDPDIYAGGDCAEVVNLMTGEKVLMPLGSTANKHGRVIGTNLAGGRETFPGVTGNAIARVFEYNVARVGLNELQAQKAGYETVTAIVPGYEHATYYPDSKQIMVKLVAEKASGRLLGGQVVGPGDTAKRIDVLATAISLGATVNDLANLDLAYAPPYNSAMDPLNNAANVIRNKQAGYARALTPAEVRSKMERGDDFIFLDVRSQEEWDTCHIGSKQVKLLPITELRQRLGELPRDKEIVTSCRTSIRAYQAQRILDGAGFKDVKFMDGSITNWIYDVVCPGKHAGKSAIAPEERLH